MRPATRKNLTVIAPCLAVIAVMCGVVAYSPTLYRLFCAATGLAGTTQRVYSDTAALSKRTITVAFDSNVAPGLPWRFMPAQRAVRVHLGEQKLVYFIAENDSDAPIIGHATFNVTPLRSGVYFNKIQCFCFTDERLDPHERVNMPVVFFVDPA
ncbi:MAG: cytochrome c oxidase assembly protein, partial [Pseudomonadota bacterium]